MQWAERAALAAWLLAGIAHADTPTYGKVETFQPGKKYNCVPTADRKGWDCSESGKAESAPARAATPAEPAPAQAVAAPAPAAEALPKTSALPGYLMNPAAGDRPAPTTRTPPPAPQAEPAPEPAAAAPAEPPKTEAPPQPTPPPPPAAPETRAAAAPGPASSPSDFLALPGSQYVVELAHANSASELKEPAVPSGKVYKLHLRQNGNENWLLVWGPFDSVEAARSARDQAIAQDLTPGWPRPIGSLQAEVRRASE